MKKPLHLFLIAVAVTGWPALMGGCASKPPSPEPAAAPPKSEPVAQSAGASAAGKSDPSGVVKEGIKTEVVGVGSETKAGLRGPSASGSTATVPSVASSPPAGSAGDHSGSALPPAQGQTGEERRAAIDKRLNDSLGTFDAKLRIEQQKIAKERDGRQTAVTTVAASDGSADAGNDGTDRSNTGIDSRSPRLGRSKSDRTAGDLKSDKGNGSSAAGNGAVANEIPDGNDDDVVARRLRKAAEQETDPELKDKLWKEYVEYKKNMQGK
jgi:hypothetical protein